jgi:recombinational DNA repair protein RecR
MTKRELIECKNCGHKYEGYYCSICRQSADTSRITWKEIIEHFLSVVIDVDKGFFYTVKEMLIRPGKTISDYLQGKRIDHFNPLMF